MLHGTRAMGSGESPSDRPEGSKNWLLLLRLLGERLPNLDTKQPTQGARSSGGPRQRRVLPCDPMRARAPTSGRLEFPGARTQM